MAGDLNIIGAASLARVLDRGSARRGREQAELDVVADGAVAVRNGRIVAVGRTATVLREAGGGVPTIDASGRTVLPGLVECHSHPLFGGDRHWEYASRLGGATRQELLERGGGIWASVLATRETPDDVLLDNAVRAYRRILSGGATTLEVKTGYGLTVEQELRCLRLLQASSKNTPLDLVYTFLGAHVVPSEAVDAQAYATMVAREMLPLVQEQGIAEFHDLVCESDVFPAPVAAQLLVRSQQLGMPTRVHADASGASDGWRTAVAGCAVAADHLTYTPDEEIRSVGGTDTIAVLLPVAEQLYLDNRRANARLFIEHQVPVAIATDYCSSLHPTSLLLTIALATSWYRMTPAEAIVAATLNSAYVLHRAHDRGSLDVGKRGDLILLDCGDPDEIAVSMGSSLLDAVVIEGEVVDLPAGGRLFS